MKKIIFGLFFFTFFIILSSCSNPLQQGQVKVDGLFQGLFPGQWTTPQTVSLNTYYIRGYKTHDAMRGGQNHCANLGKNFSMVILTPQTSSEAATMTFKCE